MIECPKFILSCHDSEFESNTVALAELSPLSRLWGVGTPEGRGGKTTHSKARGTQGEDDMLSGPALHGSAHPCNFLSILWVFKERGN